MPAQSAARLKKSESDQRLDNLAHPCLIEIDAADDGFADLRRDRKMLEHLISDEAPIDAAQSVGKSFQHAF